MIRFALALTLLPALTGCSSQEEIPPCSNMGDVVVSRKIQLLGEEVFYSICVLTPEERERWGEGVPVPDLDHVYEVGRSGGEGGSPSWPLLVFEEGRQSLFGFYLYHAQLQPAPALGAVTGLEQARLEGGDKAAVDSSFLPINITNGTDQEIFFGSDHAIDVLIDDQWFALPLAPNAGFTSMLYGLLPGEVFPTTAWLDGFRTDIFQLVPGTYRIRWQVYMSSDQQNPDWGFPHTLTLQFDLE